MIVHPTLIAPHFHSTGPEDYDAEAEKATVCFLRAWALARHNSVCILITHRAGHICCGSLVDGEVRVLAGISGDIR